MKRTNEAFKDEVFRRYRTEVHNRRNLRIYTTSTLALFILAGAFAFSVFTGRIPLPAPVASLLNPPSANLNELANYFDDTVTDLELVNVYGNGSTITYDCTEKETTETIALLKKLSLSPIDGEPEQSGLLYRIRAKFPPAQSGELRELILVFYEDGSVRVNRIQQNSNFPYIEYFQISEADFDTLLEYFESKVGEAAPVSRPSEVTETPDLPNAEEVVPVA